MTQKRVAHVEEVSKLSGVLTELSQILSVYHPQASVRFPQTVLDLLSEIASMGAELQHLFLEGFHLTHREIPWRVAFLVALCANMITEAGLTCEEASTLLARVLHEVGVPASCARIALVRYRRLIKGEEVEEVDEYVLPVEMHNFSILKPVE